MFHAKVWRYANLNGRESSDVQEFDSPDAYRNYLSASPSFFSPLFDMTWFSPRHSPSLLTEKAWILPEGVSLETWREKSAELKRSRAEKDQKKRYLESALSELESYQSDFKGNKELDEAIEKTRSAIAALE